MNSPTFKAIMIGATGATGSHLLLQLLSNDKCVKITSISRRPSKIDKKNNKKLNEILIDNMNDLSSTETAWKDNDVFFNCIGTTRTKAGSANKFLNIEFGISLEAAKMAFNANIPNACLISAKGVNHKIWGPAFIHPLFYMKIMGKKEQTIVNNYKFKYATIFQPGMLSRLQSKDSLIEKFMQRKNIKLRVDLLAGAMIKEAEGVILKRSIDGIKYITGNNQISSILK
tara:strand:- start:115 stop:798 length:684 start_codon:yes stop_codon:yes gene_type:complete